MLPPKRVTWALIILALIVLLAGVTLATSQGATAAETDSQPAAVPLIREPSAAEPAENDPHAALPSLQTDDQACRLCHEDTDAVVVFPTEEVLPVQVDPEIFDASAHSILPDDPLACTSCHAAAEYQFPHPPVEADSLREYEILRAQTCERCHVQPHITSHPDLEDAQPPVICTDCHSPHATETSEEWFEGENVTRCATCHEERGVDFTNPARLTQVIQNNLFTDEPDNEYCLACHSLPNLSMQLDSGQTLFLTVDEEAFHDSVHGLENEWRLLECRDCHEGYIFPHEPVVADTIREYELLQTAVCADCHEEKAEEALDGVHGEALEAGNENAAVCTDCHGAHYVPDPDEPRARISYTCEQCHSTIFDEYADSVHGEALLEEDNPDVAVCTDCHGVHFIPDPDLAAFRNNSPELCGKCHADESLMEQYDISTEVFDTYVDDFHGTTTVLFEAHDEDVATNTAVCFDCHGVHDIEDPDDPDSNLKANLLDTCRECHPDATTSFPDSWMSHYQPSLEHYPLVFLVNWFYRIIIPGTVGFLGFLVATDVYRRVRERSKDE